MLQREGAMKEQKIGYVSNYFSKISVAAVVITDGTLAVGDSTLHADRAQICKRRRGR
jgi:hypothetical protein